MNNFQGYTSHDIDHPLQAGWSVASQKVFDKNRRQDIEDQFSSGSTDITKLFDAIEIASMRTDNHRFVHERENLHLLELEGTNLDTYERYSQAPTRPADYIRWFGSVATTALVRSDHTYNFDKISLELGGKRQGGNWSSTHELDEMVRGIRSDFSPGALHVFGDNQAPVDKKYLLMPQFELNSVGTYDYDFAVLRRRRPVLDVYMPPLKSHVELFKESIALIVMNELDTTTKTFITQSHDMKTYQENNTPAAIAAGEVFEVSIVQAKNLPREVVPINAHYIMAMERDKSDMV